MKNYSIKLLIYIFLSFIIIKNASSQIIIKGIIKDSQTKEVLSYCNVSIKGTYKGTISNADGNFTIEVKTTDDVLVFSYLGYESKLLSAKAILNNKVVFLAKKDMEIGEVTIHAGNDYLFDIMTKCRKKLLENKITNTAKVYYGIQTKSKDQPVELLECYYTGVIEGEKIEQLKFKNGRVALATVDSNYFETFNTAKAISKLNITNKNDYYPAVPLGFGKTEMKKHFELEMIDFDNTMLHIAFKPRNNKESFSGDIWIEKGSYNILKIELRIENAGVHPFEPMHEIDQLHDITMNICNTYNIVDNNSILDHINFDYNFKYKSIRDTTFLSGIKVNRVLEREISSKGIIRLYDYGNPFIVPYFEYPKNLYYGDYYKMSFIPNNDVFWSNNNTMILTEEQKNDLGFFTEKGMLINYINEESYGSKFLINRPRNIDVKNNRHFGFYYPFWSSDKRVILKNDFVYNKTYDQWTINTKIPTDLYSFVVQILLDVNQVVDSLNCRTFTVFDVYESFFHLTPDDYTNAFINIFFDICEIERRKLDKKLHENNYTAKEVDIIYKASTVEMDKITKKYLKEVNLGKNMEQLKKWNKYVIDELNIDNIGLIKETIKAKNK